MATLELSDYFVRDNSTVYDIDLQEIFYIFLKEIIQKDFFYGIEIVKEMFLKIKIIKKIYLFK